MVSVMPEQTRSKGFLSASLSHIEENHVGKHGNGAEEPGRSEAEGRNRACLSTMLVLRLSPNIKKLVLGTGPPVERKLAPS